MKLYLKIWRSIIVCLLWVYCGSLFAQETDVLVRAGTYKDFSVQSRDYTTHTWYIDGEYIDTGDAINILFSEEGTYEVSVQAESFGCLSPFTYITVNVYQEYVEEPDDPNEGNKYPEIKPDKYFTPNGDGIHDRWEIENIEYYPDSDIEIYDRYSKLLVRYKGTDLGWDGIYNGKPMRTDDYWYIIKLHKVRDWISGHFTLKR